MHSLQHVATSILAMLSLACSSAVPEWMPANPSLTGFAKSLPAAPLAESWENVDQKSREIWKIVQQVLRKSRNKGLSSSFNQIYSAETRKIPPFHADIKPKSHF